MRDLSLPQWDRGPLTRQLYKGRAIDEVLATDPDYLERLSAQDWFRAKYISLHQVIINRGAEPEETPEHNAL